MNSCGLSVALWPFLVALRADGAAVCWGSNSSGQSTPAAGPFQALEAGAYHTCGLRADGAAVCWGDNYFGQSTPRTRAGPRLRRREPLAAQRDRVGGFTIDRSLLA